MARIYFEGAEPENKPEKKSRKEKVENPFVQVPKTFYSHMPVIGSSALALYVCLLSHVNRTDAKRDGYMTAYPGVVKISKETGLSPESIKEARERLCVLGYLEFEKHGTTHKIWYFPNKGILDQKDAQSKVNAESRLTAVCEIR